MRLTLADRLQPSGAVAARQHAEGTMLVDLSRGYCWELNRLGGEVWDLLDGARPLAQVVKGLQARYDVPEEVLVRDVLAVVEHMLQQNLVVIVAGAAP